MRRLTRPRRRWESFIIHLDILSGGLLAILTELRIFHYSPWYTYWSMQTLRTWVENLSLFTLIYLAAKPPTQTDSWESFISHLDILTSTVITPDPPLRIFHYSPWYTYGEAHEWEWQVENLSLFTLIYLWPAATRQTRCWESFIIHLDILTVARKDISSWLRIFHYSPWYT